ncbi:sodium:proton antiporter [Rhizobium sp. Root274]|uniref:iron-sulfur cluster carrier protein ApbC n=1 Tax=unclassified Rhizobium TaxID=2613769 RepID=UPI000713F8E3|nr:MULTISPECIES: iron-sulfur cluster carrier protein ApbC [unclassified Rhizobium]KQW32327.1 sodium:proton antiporter [Rhizobium sp. Root1240]KRD33872.1 sodium:proton antiporter [Rhizobium sp. Root274]
MAELTRDVVLEALGRVRGPDLDRSIVELKMVSDIFISDGKVYFSINVPAERAQELEPLRQAAERTVKALPGVKGAVVSLTAERKQGSAPPPPRPQVGAPAHSHSPAQGHSHAPAPSGTQRSKAGVPGIGAIIAVASGKGGVGKSTTAVNLALALKANGLRVGILDADVYGPSMPRLLGITGRPQQIENRIIVPMENFGIKVMSMGFLVDEGTAMIWRGPMVQSALMQMLREVAWGDLDVLVVDMPPGTGDAQLTMAQQVPLSGAVIVSTPQDLALIDARKGLNMFNKVEVPVLGIIENMSYFIAPDTGNRYDIFGHGGARAEAEAIGVPFLGEVPLTISIREHSDAGTPVVVAEPDSPQTAVYLSIAEKVWAEVKARSGRAAPAIVFE